MTLQNISSPIYIQLGIHSSFLFTYPSRYYVKDTIASPRVSDFTYNLCFDMQAVSNMFNYITSTINVYDGSNEKSITIYFTKSTSIISLRNIKADVMNAQGKQYYCFVMGY